MATSDLTNELLSPSAEAVLNDSISYKIVEAVLNTLQDKNGEVQNMGVKCLSALVSKLKEMQVQMIIDRLSQFTDASNSNAELRDISSTALRTVITEIPSNTQLSQTLIAQLLPRLLMQLNAKNASNMISPDTIQILHDLFIRFGREIAAVGGAKGLHELQKGLFGLLESSSAARRKKAVLCLGALSAYQSDMQFGQLMSLIHEMLVRAKSDEKIRTLVSLLQALCRSDTSGDVTTAATSGSGGSMSSRSAGFAAHAIRHKSRFGGYIKGLEVKVQECVDSGDEDETREAGLACLETFVQRNPNEMTHFIPNLIRLGLDNLKHDPNYVQSDNEEDEMPDSQTSDLEDQDENDDYDETEEYSDDDDVSWKVRRAAAKLLTAVIIAFPSVLAGVYKDVAPTLISRFNEREESVRVEILATFRELVKCTGLQGEEILLSRDVPVGMGKRRRESSQSGERPAPPKALGEQLAALVPRMSRSLTRQLMGNSVPTKLAGFALARAVVDVLGGGIGDVLPSFIRPIETAMETHAQSKISTVTAGGSANESNLKIETLKFVKSIFKMHTPEVIGTSSAMDLANVVNGAISSERFYKVVAEALETVVPVVITVGALEDPKNRVATVTLAESIKSKVIAPDVDQEVRERAIIALGTVLKVLGPTAGFEVLFDRLKIESVRLVTVKVIADVVEHSFVSGGPWVDAIVGELSTYLRRTNREVKASSLKALLAIISKFPSDCSQGQMETLVENVCSVLNSDDTQLFSAALDVLTLILERCHSLNEKQFDGPVLTMVVSLFWRQVVPSQGSAWASYGRFLAEYARRCTPAAASLVPRLLPTKEMDGNAVACNAKALATILCYGSGQMSENPLKALLGPPLDPDTETFWLMVTGEAGKITDAWDVAATVPFEVLLQRMARDDEKARSAAAFAVGGVAAGQIKKYFPTLLDYLSRSMLSHERSPILHAIKEVITFNSEPSRVHFLNEYDIWGILFNEHILRTPADRNLASECAGQYLLTRPQQFVNLLEDQAKSPSWYVRATFVSAIRFTMSDSTESRYALDTILASRIVEFFNLLRDVELEVRRQALVTLNATAHSKPFLIKAQLSKLLPLLYAELQPRKDLMRIVVMGPFKHTIDDGLETRRSAYEALYSVLENLFAAIDDVDGFVAKVVTGLDDQHEIKILCSLMLTRLAAAAPLETQNYLEAVTPKFQAMLVISARDKDSVTRQDIEKQHEMRRSCIRTSVALAQLQSPDITPLFSKYIKDLRTSRDSEKEFRMFSEELKNTGLGAATLRNLSDITSMRTSSSSRGEPMDTS